MKKILQFLIPILIVATAAYAIDRTYKAPSGDLILDANNDVVVNKNLGINQSAPVRNIHVSDTSTAFMQWTTDDSGHNNTDGTLIGLNGNDDFQIYNYESSEILFATSGAQRMNIESDGDVVVNEKLGIGSAGSPGALNPLKIKDAWTGGISDVQIENTSTTSGDGLSLSLFQSSDADTFMKFWVNDPQYWSMGIDNDDGNNFKISAASSLGSNNRLLITPTGKTELSARVDSSCGIGNVCSGTTAPASGTPATWTACSTSWQSTTTRR